MSHPGPCDKEENIVDLLYVKSSGDNVFEKLAWFNDERDTVKIKHYYYSHVQQKSHPSIMRCYCRFCIWKFVRGLIDWLIDIELSMSWILAEYSWWVQVYMQYNMEGKKRVAIGWSWVQKSRLSYIRGNSLPCRWRFVNDLLQFGGFLLILQFPPPIKLTATIKLMYCWMWR